jgi:uncharacterized lipoprotein YehR (DUF1307 family)
MKNILISLLFTFAVYADGVFYIQKSSGDVVLENVKNNVLSTNAPIVGQTYTVNGNNYAFKTSTNSEVTVAFSNDVFINVKETAHLTFDNFDQKFDNLNDLPTKVKYSTYTKSVSLISGELDVCSNQGGDTSSIATINTSLASIMLSKGKFVIQADDRTTVVIVLDGSAVILDNSSKRKENVKANQTVVIVPAPKFQGRGVDTMRRGNIFSIKETAKGDGESYLLGVNAVDEDAKHVRFCIIDKTVRGVRID